MVYRVPDTENENEKTKFLVPKGIYYCYNYDCNKPQKIDKIKDYLQPCKYCGCKTFWTN